MPYTIINAIKEEIDFLEELAEVEKKEEHPFAAAICRSQKTSLERILRRVEKGHEFYLGETKGKPALFYRETNRKTLQEEYPVLKKLAEQYELFETLVQSETVAK